MKTLKIGHRIIIGLAIMAGLVLLASTFTFYVTTRMDRVLHQVSTRTQQGIGLLNEIFHCTYELQDEERRLLYQGEREQGERIRDNLRMLEGRVQHLQLVAQNGVESKVLERLSVQAEQYSALQLRIVELYQAGKTDEARLLASEEAAPLRWNVVSQCKDVLDAYEYRLVNETSHYNQFGLQLKGIALVLAIVAVLAAVLLSAHGIRTTLVPLRHLVDTSKEIRSGNLDGRAAADTADELGELALSFNQMLDNLQDRMHQIRQAEHVAEHVSRKLRQRNDQIMRELRLARQIQKGIVPSHFSSEGLKVFTRLEAARQVGGDFFDLVPNRHKKSEVTCLIGDVMGQGIPAALLMVSTLTTMRELLRATRSPRELLAATNERIREQVQDEEYTSCVSAAAVTLDLEQRSMVYCKAGHEEILWWHAADGTVSSIGTSGLFLGVLEDGLYEEAEAQLEPGDKLVLYTDGLSEARNALQELFGADRLVRLVEQNGAESVEALGTCILDTVSSFRGHLELSDDIALVILEVE